MVIEVICNFTAAISSLYHPSPNLDVVLHSGHVFCIASSQKLGNIVIDGVHRSEENSSSQKPCLIELSMSIKKHGIHKNPRAG